LESRLSTLDQTVLIVLVSFLLSTFFSVILSFLFTYLLVYHYCPPKVKELQWDFNWSEPEPTWNQEEETSEQENTIPPIYYTPSAIVVPDYYL
jgi:hypothetical protein